MYTKYIKCISNIKIVKKKKTHIMGVGEKICLIKEHLLKVPL